MRKLLFFMCYLVSYSAVAQNPDTLLYERFETGGASFTLNTTDLGGAVGNAGSNGWVINNAYTGGSGQLICLGFPFNFTIPATAFQPAGITGGTTTNYLHIVSDAGIASGVQNCSFAAADGICTLDETNFAAMAQDVSTNGYDSVTVSFLWLCSGGTNIYGEFYYSTNSGTSWNVVTTPVSQYKNQSNWVQQNITVAGFAGQSTIRFGFRFVNQNSASAADPGFGIDEFMITGKNATPAPVAGFTVSDSELCQSGCVDYTDISTGNPTTWLWIFQGAATAFSTQQNPSQICYNSPGTYEVTLIVTGASGTDTLTTQSVIVHPDPPQPVITFSGDTLFATPGFSSYQWSLNGSVIPGATNDFYVVLADGAYTVSVADSNGCNAESVILNYATGLNEVTSELQLIVYPNPSNGIFHIQNAEEYLSIDVVNAVGEIILNLSVENLGSSTLDLKNKPKGVYFLDALHHNGYRQFIKLINW